MSTLSGARLREVPVALTTRLISNGIYSAEGINVAARGAALTVT